MGLPPIPSGKQLSWYVCIYDGPTRVRACGGCKELFLCVWMHTCKIMFVLMFVHVMCFEVCMYVVSGLLILLQTEIPSNPFMYVCMLYLWLLSHWGRHQGGEGQLGRTTRGGPQQQRQGRHHGGVGVSYTCVGGLE